jgi:hypothetical protein
MWEHYDGSETTAPNGCRIATGFGMGLKKRLRGPAEGEFLFEIDETPLEESLTSFGGLPLFLRAVRSLGVPASVRRHLQLKQRRRGVEEAGYVETILTLNALGGECLDDLVVLREDAGVASMLGYQPPSPEAARQFLYQFHDEEKIVAARQQQLQLQRASIIPGESAALAGLAAVNRDVVGELGRRSSDQRIATVDLDATIIESHKRQAQPTYQGTTGYQPLLALWAEMDVVLADQFRDGNTPAIQEPLAVAQRAYETLPGTVNEYYFRGDAACYENDLLDWLRNPQRSTGPQGVIGFAVSAPVHAPLKAEILQLDESVWQLYRDESTARLECAVVPYYPEEKGDPYREPLRYLAIRVRPKQGELFADGAATKHFAVATNLWDWQPKRLLEWHREKAGSIEALHDVLKNELAAGVLPCARFGANAAWLRLSALTHNVLTAMKRLALPPELLPARPKRLRFLVFSQPGKFVRHARQLKLRLTRVWRRFSNWAWAFEQLPLPAPG